MAIVLPAILVVGSCVMAGLRWLEEYPDKERLKDRKTAGLSTGRILGDAKRRSGLLGRIGMSARIGSNLLFLLSNMGLIAAGYLLRLVAPTASPHVVELSRSLLLSAEVYPEPQDPFMYVGIVLVAGLILLGIALASGKFVKSNGNAVFALSIISMLVTVVLLNQSFDFKMTVVVLIGVSVGIAAHIFLSRTIQEAYARAIIFALYPAALFLVISQRIWTEGSLLYSGMISSHYEAVTSSIIRIATGGTCLADVLPQYGCYGEFLSPILSIFGSSIVVVTSVFAILLIISISFALVFASVIIRNRIVLLGCSTCLVMIAAFNLHYDSVDPVLQYYPLSV